MDVLDGHIFQVESCIAFAKVQSLIAITREGREGVAQSLLIYHGDVGVLREENCQVDNILLSGLQVLYLLCSQ